MWPLLDRQAIRLLTGHELLLLRLSAEGDPSDEAVAELLRREHPTLALGCVRDEAATRWLDAFSAPEAGGAEGAGYFLVCGGRLLARWPTGEGVRLALLVDEAIVRAKRRSGASQHRPGPRALAVE